MVFSVGCAITPSISALSVAKTVASWPDSRFIVRSAVVSRPRLSSMIQFGSRFVKTDGLVVKTSSGVTSNSGDHPFSAAGSALIRIQPGTGSDGYRDLYVVVVISNKPHKRIVLDNQFSLTGNNVNSIHVVKPMLISVIDANQNFFGKPVAGANHLSRDFLKWCQVTSFVGIQVNAIKMKVFIAVIVLRKSMCLPV